MRIWLMKFLTDHTLEEKALRYNGTSNIDIDFCNELIPP